MKQTGFFTLVIIFGSGCAQMTPVADSRPPTVESGRREMKSDETGPLLTPAVAIHEKVLAQPDPEPQLQPQLQPQLRTQTQPPMQTQLESQQLQPASSLTAQLKLPSNEEVAATVRAFDPNFDRWIPVPTCQQYSKDLDDDQLELILETVANDVQRPRNARAFAQVAHATECPAPLANAHADHYNHSGERLLFEHARLWNHLQDVLSANGEPCLIGWTHLPGEREVKPVVKNEEVASQADSNHFLSAWDSDLADEDWLAMHSLSQVGWALEFSIKHNLLARFAQPALSSATEDDWLLDPLQSQTNPVYWHIQGYIEHVMRSWLVAHDLTRFDVDCKGQPGCYQWPPRLSESDPEANLVSFDTLGKLNESDLTDDRGTASEEEMADPFVAASRKVCPFSH